MFIFLCLLMQKLARTKQTARKKSSPAKQDGGQYIAPKKKSDDDESDDEEGSDMDTDDQEVAETTPTELNKNVLRQNELTLLKLLHFREKDVIHTLTSMSFNKTPEVAVISESMLFDTQTLDLSVKSTIFIVKDCVETIPHFTKVIPSHTNLAILYDVSIPYTPNCWKVDNGWLFTVCVQTATGRNYYKLHPHILYLMFQSFLTNTKYLEGVFMHGNREVMKHKLGMSLLLPLVPPSALVQFISDAHFTSQVKEAMFSVMKDLSESENLDTTMCFLSDTLQVIGNKDINETIKSLLEHVQGKEFYEEKQAQLNIEIDVLQRRMHSHHVHSKSQMLLTSMQTHLLPKIKKDKRINSLVDCVVKMQQLVMSEPCKMAFHLFSELNMDL